MMSRAMPDGSRALVGVTTTLAVLLAALSVSVVLTIPPELVDSLRDNDPAGVLGTAGAFGLALLVGGALSLGSRLYGSRRCLRNSRTRSTPTC